MSGERPCAGWTWVNPENYLLMVASGDSAAEEDRIVREVKPHCWTATGWPRDGGNGVVPFIAVSSTDRHQLLGTP